MAIENLTYEELKFGFEHRMLDADEIHSTYEMSKRQDTIKRFTEEFGYKPKQIQTGKYKGEWYIELPNKDKRTKKRKKTKKEIEDLILEFMGQYENNPTIEEVFIEWNNRRLMLKQIAPSSHTRLKQCYDRHYKEFGKKHIKGLTPNDFSNFLEEEIPKRNLSYTAFRDLKSLTKGMLKHAKKNKLIIWEPDTMLSNLDVSERQFKETFKEDYELVFDEEETAQMIGYCKANFDMRNAPILLMFVTGMRIGEVATLKHDDFNVISNTIRVRRSETRYKNNEGKDVYEVVEHPKTKHGYREIVVPSAYRGLLEKLYFMSTSTEYVFEEKGKRVTTLLIRKREYNLCKKLGIHKKSPHKIRATYDTILLDSGLDKKFVTDQMGHSSIKVSENNYHRDRRKIDKKRQLLDSIGEFNAV